jgi:hypothetical protein
MERLKKTPAELRVKEAELKNALTGSEQSAANEVRYQLRFAFCSCMSPVPASQTLEKRMYMYSLSIWFKLFGYFVLGPNLNRVCAN